MTWHAKPCLFDCQCHDVADSYVAAVLWEDLTDHQLQVACVPGQLHAYNQLLPLVQRN